MNRFTLVYHLSIKRTPNMIMEDTSIIMSSQNPAIGAGPVITAKLDLEEDVEAELEDFMLLSRLGVENEAYRLLTDVLWSHISFFPVFVEAAYFLFRTKNFKKLEQLTEDSVSTIGRTGSEEERDFFKFISGTSKQLHRLHRSSPYKEQIPLRELLERKAELSGHNRAAEVSL